MAIKLMGSLGEVFRAQGHSEQIIKDFEKNRGFETNKLTILCDLPRISLVDFHGTHEAFTTSCQDDRIYVEHYLQGNFDGGSALDIYDLYYVKAFKEMTEEAGRLKKRSRERSVKEEEAAKFYTEWAGGRKYLRFAFPDDDGNLCGFGFVFNVFEPDHWAFHITRHTNAPLNARTAIVFAEGNLARSCQGISVASDAIASEIASALNSKMLSQVISGLINTDGKICLEKFNQLNDRLRGGNIDNRDVKQTLLNELYLIAKSNISEDTGLKTSLDTFAHEIANEPDFFRYGIFEKNVLRIYDVINDSIRLQSPKEEANRLLFNNTATLYAIFLDSMATRLRAEELAPQRKVLQEEAKILREARDNPNSDVAIISSNPIFNKLSVYVKTMRQSVEYYTEKEKQIISRKSLALENREQTIFQRNPLTILSGVSGLLITISLILVITGVLAPIGLVLAGSIANMLGISAAVAFGILSFASAAIVINNETGFLSAEDDDLSVCQRLQLEKMDRIHTDFLQNITSEPVKNTKDVEELFSRLELNRNDGEKIVGEGLRGLENLTAATPTKQSDADRLDEGLTSNTQRLNL